MTRISEGNFTGKEGVTKTKLLCDYARVIFREIEQSKDVGIDAYIEPQYYEMASGCIIGAQIKSGNSYCTSDGRFIKFKAEKKHLLYWKMCQHPVVGIVYSNHHDFLVWFDLKEYSTDDRIKNGPYTITIERTSDMDLNVRTIHENLIRKYILMSNPLLSDAEIYSMLYNIEPDGIDEILYIVFDHTIDPDNLAHALYDLSWRFPAIANFEPDKARDIKEKLAKMTDLDLLHLCKIFTLHDVTFTDHAANVILDLIAYIPDVTNRLRSILGNREYNVPAIFDEMTIEFIEMAIQVLEQDDY